jgi:hypothetical protein
MPIVVTLQKFQVAQDVSLLWEEMLKMGQNLEINALWTWSSARV